MPEPDPWDPPWPAGAVVTNFAPIGHVSRFKTGGTLVNSGINQDYTNVRAAGNYRLEYTHLPPFVENPVTNFNMISMGLRLEQDLEAILNHNFLGAENNAAAPNAAFTFDAGRQPRIFDNNARYVQFNPTQTGSSAPNGGAGQGVIQWSGLNVPGGLLLKTLLPVLYLC